MKRNWDVFAIISAILAVGVFIFWANSWNRTDILRVQDDVQEIREDFHKNNSLVLDKIQASEDRIVQELSQKLEGVRKENAKEIQRLGQRVNCISNRLSRIEGTLDQQFKNKITLTAN